MSSIPEKFTGYGPVSVEGGKAFEFEKISYTPPTWTEDDVDVKISHSSICGSDLHVITSGWPRPTVFPAIVGHEIVGTVVRAGANAGHTVGTRVGIGAQGSCCLDCSYCDIKKEQFCEQGFRGTYQARFEDGTVTQGGYANFIRCKGRMAVPIPEALSSSDAAPLLCAGVTVFNVLKRWGCGPGKTVGVVGIGGLGHLALQFASAMGGETFALSHSSAKAADAEKLGVKPSNFIVTSDVDTTAVKYARSLDIIVCTSSHALPIESLYFKLLKPEGVLVLCGLPEEKIPSMWVQAMGIKGLAIAGTLVGGTAQIAEMFALAAEKNVRPWTEIRPLKDVAQACKDMDAGKAHYRYVLEI